MSSCSSWAATGSTFFSSHLPMASRMAVSSAMVSVTLMGFGSPVFAHDLAGPGRLAQHPARQEALEHRLDVDHRRPVDRVEALDLQRRPAHADNAADADPQ